MNLKEFVKSSERTMATNLYIDSNKKINLLHSAVGVSTEVGEIAECMRNGRNSDLDVVNLSEELADLVWYLAIPIRDFSFDIDTICEDGSASIDALFILSANYLDMVKKIAFYNKPLLVDDVSKHVKLLYDHVVTIADKYGIDLEKSFSNNQDKLRKRYPEKYDNEKALNRDLYSERKELEKGM